MCRFTLTNLINLQLLPISLHFSVFTVFEKFSPRRKNKYGSMRIRIHSPGIYRTSVRIQIDRGQLSPSCTTNRRHLILRSAGLGHLKPSTNSQLSILIAKKYATESRSPWDSKSPRSRPKKRTRKRCGSVQSVSFPRIRVRIKNERNPETWKQLKTENNL